MSFDNAVAVTSVEDEYDFIREQQCPCGGSYVSDDAAPAFVQSLIFDATHKPFDRVRAQCRECQHLHDFWFDISAWYGRPFWDP